MGQPTDQAETLRRLIGNAEEAIHSPLPERMITFITTCTKLPASVFLPELLMGSSALFQPGQKMLLVDAHPSSPASPPAESSDPEAYSFQDSSAEDLQNRVTEVIRPLGSDLWFLPYKRLTFKVRRPVVDILRVCGRAFGTVCIDSGLFNYEDSHLAFAFPQYPTVISMSNNEFDQARTLELIRALNRKRGVQKLAVIVNGVTEANSAQLIFRRFSDLAQKYFGAKLFYLGMIPVALDEIDPVLKISFLLNSKNETSNSEKSYLISCLDLIRKRLGELR